MKTNLNRRKLILNKRTIACLDSDQMMVIRGGDPKDTNDTDKCKCPNKRTADPKRTTIIQETVRVNIPTEKDTDKDKDKNY